VLALARSRLREETGARLVAGNALFD